MISKIIQKEKERQEFNMPKSSMIPSDESWVKMIQEGHKQSLINLKEYMEELNENVWVNLDDESFIKLEEDIQELNLMIEKYD